MRVMFRVFIAIGAILAGQTASAQQYTVTDLGTVGGGAGQAYAINDAGTSAGWSQNVDGQQTATMWSSDGATGLPGTSDAKSTIALGIGPVDTVVGYINTLPGTRAAVWDDGVLTVLPTLGCNCQENVIAHAVNSSGHVAVTSNRAHVGTTAFVWQSGALTLLGSNRTGDNTVALGINDNGDVVGAAAGQPVVWWGGDPNNVTPLGTLGGGGGSAVAINASGQVVGLSAQDDGTSHAFFWDPTYGMQNLGTLGGPVSEARAINGDIVVGDSETADNSIHAFIYDVQGPGYPIDLNDLIAADSGWVLTAATGVNASGQIVGFGTFGGETRAFLLTPVASNPE